MKHYSESKFEINLTNASSLILILRKTGMDYVTTVYNYFYLGSSPPEASFGFSWYMLLENASNSCHIIILCENINTLCMTFQIIHLLSVSLTRKP